HAPRDHRLLVVGSARIPPLLELHPGAIAPRELRMEDHTGPPDRRPAHALRVPPSLVADRDAERDTVDCKEAAPAIGDVPRLLLGRDLVLPLPAQERAVACDDERPVVQPDR